MQNMVHRCKRCKRNKLKDSEVGWTSNNHEIMLMKTMECLKEITGQWQYYGEGWHELLGNSVGEWKCRGQGGLMEIKVTECGNGNYHGTVDKIKCEI